MNYYVLDACAIIAYLRGEDGSDIIESILSNKNNICMIHSINLCEVYYDFLKVTNETVAKSAIDDVINIGVVAREDMDASIWQAAGKVKTRGRVSLADCFAIALANKEQAAVVTSDHAEFERINTEGICAVKFFR